eukprot:scaffold26143_cov60-Phaeocystis_antarctica.AAC.1
MRHGASDSGAREAAAADRCAAAPLCNRVSQEVCHARGGTLCDERPRDGGGLVGVVESPEATASRGERRDRAEHAKQQQRFTNPSQYTGHGVKPGCALPIHLSPLKASRWGSAHSRRLAA